MLHIVKMVATVFIFSGIFYCCKKSATIITLKPDVIFKATISGASEIPPNTSTGKGLATLTFNDNTKKYKVIVTWSGIQTGPPLSVWIEKGAVGVSGPPLFGIGFSNPISPLNDSTQIAIDSTQEADLKANLYYVNFYTVDYPIQLGGEIRGQLIKQ